MLFRSIDSANLDSTTMNSLGYFRFSWTPPHSFVAGGSFQVVHGLTPRPGLYPHPGLYPGGGTEQKIVMLECLLYYAGTDSEMMMLTQVTS